MFQSKKKKEIDRTIREWFIIINHQQLGPYSLAELKRNPQFNPDILVWKRGFQEWIKARFVPEMQEIFKDEPEAKALHEPKNGNTVERKLGQHHQVILTLQQDPFPYQFLLWLLLLFIIFYTFYHFYHF
jgi:hypothetical protein